MDSDSVITKECERDEGHQAWMLHFHTYVSRENGTVVEGVGVTLPDQRNENVEAHQVEETETTFVVSHFWPLETAEGSGIDANKHVAQQGKHAYGLECTGILRTPMEDDGILVLPRRVLQLEKKTTAVALVRQP